MKPEDSLSCSQEPATCPYPEPDESSPHTHTPYFPKIHFNIIILPSTPLSSEWSPPFIISDENSARISLSPVRG
jgi:hypothetical protein